MVTMVLEYVWGWGGGYKIVWMWSPPPPPPPALFLSVCVCVLMLLPLVFQQSFCWFYSWANVLICSASFVWTFEAPYMSRFFMHSLIYLNDLYTDLWPQQYAAKLWFSSGCGWWCSSGTIYKHAGCRPGTSSIIVNTSWLIMKAQGLFNISVMKDNDDDQHG